MYATAFKFNLFLFDNFITYILVVSLCNYMYFQSYLTD
jgi:hypothetical protein